ncbi:glucosamine-6-phosphate deaminase [Saccharomonospora azurea SZMC 14600]|uniref:6-phosphogluconolactonase n=1 Tax=Saccharomonospora azurea TaxID=40988 RepID=UPI00023FF0EF|nr:6-phosphogluconolactonase [Saccharomonospora azurea]EHK83971.1 glucosamine-6-phosphate deaminase [Saccharomonospora azurea SZMC 14600]
MSITIREILTGGVFVRGTPGEVGTSAAAVAADAILAALAERGRARVVFASAPSQEPMLTALAADRRIDWSRVTSFHMDEYLGIAADHPQAFGRWLADRLPAAARQGLLRIDPTAEPGHEAERYAALLAEAPIDLTCLGVGVNGHIAFNEPGLTRFDDPELVRLVRIDDVSRRQQVDEGLFPSLDRVPTEALSLTVPALMGATRMVASVLGEHKAAAVAAALTGPVSPQCPASVLRTHSAVSMHLDTAAVALVEPSTQPGDV